MRALLLSVLLAAGCSSNTAWKVSAGAVQPGATASVHAHTGSEVVAVFGLVLFAASAHELAFGERDYPISARRAPEMDPNRKVAEQDCTKPLDYSLGNIRCK